jgi:cAMP-binding proteins - catabolite gene activator and regulatory subunit of cAMP-dependent protein kinases
MSSTPVPPISPAAEASEAEEPTCLRVLIAEFNLADSHMYPPGVELFRQDSSPAYVYFMESGVAKLTRYEENGGEFIFDIRFPGSLLGSEAAIRKAPHPFSAVTATSCRLSQVTTRQFLGLLSTEPKLAVFIQSNLSAQLLNQVARMSEIACLPARLRLEQLLWKIAQHEGGCETMNFKLQFPIRHWEAAQLLAITPTYLSRLLADLETEEIISRKGGWIVLHNPSGLWHRLNF